MPRKATLGNYKQLTRNDYLSLIKPQKKPKKSNATNRRKRYANFEKHYHLLHLLGNTNKNKAQRKALIDTMNRQQLAAVRDALNGFLSEKITVPPRVLKNLKRDKKYIYALLQKSTPVETQKEILKQKGGFLGALMPLAGALLPSIIEPVVGGIASLIRKK